MPDADIQERTPETPAIKVAIVFSIGGLGGAERSLTRMSLANDSDGVTYSLWTLGNQGDWSKWVALLGRRGTTLDVHVLRPWTFVTFVRAMRAEAPDIVYSVGARVYLVVRMLRWLLPSIKVVQAIRATYPEGSDMARNYSAAERLFSRADGYIANSRAGAKSYGLATGVEESRIRVVLNGVDVPAESSEARPADRQQILVVANLQPRKEHIRFLEVVAAVVRRYPEARFVFAGRDDMNGAVQERARSMALDGSVEFPGFCADVSTYLRTATLFALPSREKEGAPTSILEALAHEVPVVAYASGGVAEIVRHGVDGLVIEDMSVASMANAIIELLGDPDRRSRMGNAGRHKVISDYSLRACAANHAQVWRELMSG